MTLVDLKMSSDSQEGTKSLMGRWLKSPGDAVFENEPVLEINTDKVTLEVSAPVTGILRETLKQPNDEIVPGEVLGRIEPGTSAAPASREGDHLANSSKVTPRSEEKAAPLSKMNRGLEKSLSPAVRRLVADYDLDLSVVHGTGHDGRITYEDALRATQGSAPLIALENRRGTTANKAPEIEGRRVLHSPVRKLIADHMVQSLLQTAPHVTSVFQADFSAILAHRERSKDEFDSQGVKLTLTAYIVAAAVEALKAVPQVNSRWHADELEIFPDCNIGIATAVDRGGEDSELVVPVIKKAQSRDLFGIASELQRLTEKARAFTLEPREVQGGTFTISNHGVSGSLVATPIVINQPQSAILGIGKLEKRLVVQSTAAGDSIAIRPCAYVTLTLDHRALDGYKANAFLSRFVTALGQWS